MDKEHLFKIIDILYNECRSGGGDGDAFWYSRFYTVGEILPLVEEYNSKLKFPFGISKPREDTIVWGAGQEYIIITTNEEDYLKAPNWIQFLLKY